MPADLDTLAQDILAAARKAGADAADAVVVDGTFSEINVRGGKLEQAERSEGVEIGLRVLIGQRQACVSASDTRASTLAEMATRAVAMAHEAPEDEWIGLADPGMLAEVRDASGLDLEDPAPEPEPGRLQEMAAEAEASALAVRGISQVQGASAGYSRRRIHVAVTNGFSGGYIQTGHSLSVVAITGEGTSMERDYSGEVRTHGEDMRSPRDVGREAGERTVARAGAKKPPTGAYPVLFDERISSGLIGHLVQAANGASIVRGSSWLRDGLGMDVLPKGLSVTEDPRRPRVSSSKPFDAEGLATRARDIVSDGVLKGWTLDLATARRLGMDSTASASRGTSAPPSPATTNIALTQGDRSREDLLREMGTGLLVTSMLGSSINPTTGDYSRGAGGFWVENGEIAWPVNECTIAGNLRDMLGSIVPANDARPWLSWVVPSLLVEGLTIAGS